MSFLLMLCIAGMALLFLIAAYQLGNGDFSPLYRAVAAGGSILLTITSTYTAGQLVKHTPVIETWVVVASVLALAASLVTFVLAWGVPKENGRLWHVGTTTVAVLVNVSMCAAAIAGHSGAHWASLTAQICLVAALVIGIIGFVAYVASTDKSLDKNLADR